MLLRRMVGINPALSRAIIGVGDLRIKDTITIMKRVAKLKKMPKPDLQRLLHMLGWVSFVNDVRSVVAHKPLYAKKSVMFFHNTHTAKSDDGKWVYECSISQLNNLTHIGHELCVGLTVMPNPSIFKNFRMENLEIPVGAPDAALFQKLNLPTRPQDRHSQPPQ